MILSVIFIASRELHDSNALSPIEMTELGKTTSLRLTQFEKHSSFIKVTPSSIFTVTRDLLFLKAPLATDDTFLPSNNDGIVIIEPLSSLIPVISIESSSNIR